MEGTPTPVRKPSRKRRVVLVIIVAAVVVAAGFVVWWEFVRPRTIAEIFAINHFQPGSAVTVAGTITAISWENLSYGPRVALQLDNFAGCNATGTAAADVFGDPNATYSVGQAFQTTLHFQRYTFNGGAAVSAPELACPFPGDFTAIQGVQDAVSRVTGLVLAYNSTQPGGWLDYRVVVPNALRYNLSILPATLRKSAGTPAGSPVDSASSWAALASLQYVGSVGSSMEFPIVDRMTSLAAGTSANGSLRFIDTNRDGMLDDGDRLDARIPATTSANAWDTYLLEIGGTYSSTPTYVGAAHYILSGPNGPLDLPFSSQPAMVDLAWAGDQPGPPIRTTVRVASFPLGTPPPVSSVSLQLYDMNASPLLEGSLASLPATTSNGLTFTYTDANSDGRFDVGDFFTLTGASNRSGFQFLLFSNRRTIGIFTWIVGYGEPYPVSRNVTFTVQGSGPWRMTASVPTWSPELALNRTLRATLTENGHAVLTDLSLVNGTIGTFTNGTLAFTDADGDGYLSTGDFFTLNGDPTAYYVLQLTLLFSEPLPPVSV